MYTESNIMGKHNYLIADYFLDVHDYRKFLLLADNT
jgi:hypothetical protein